MFLSPFQLLDEPQFRCITKIKTIGSTYMAASGVTPDVSNGYACMKVSFSVKLMKKMSVFVKDINDSLSVRRSF